VAHAALVEAREFLARVRAAPLVTVCDRLLEASSPVV
jgi:hypothetical protein